MFKFLTPKPDADASNPATTYRATSTNLRQTPTFLAATFIGTLLMAGCQQQPEPVTVDDSQTTEQTRAEDNEAVVQSESAAARIEQFQPLYVAQAQSLQRRLQAEYESLQAADTSDSDNALLLNSTAESSNNDDKTTIDANTNKSDGALVTETGNSNKPAESVSTNTDATVNNSEDKPEVAAEINTSTEVGERDLTVLKRISLEPRKPKILTEEQMIERYQQAMEALYQSVATPLSAQDTDTLLNIATLVPQLFEHAEIAGRVSAKSPALARLIIQHQVWEQIEAQQVLDMQQMKVVQQQEFESLMGKFNDTIKGYDEQIAKYEQTLKEFQ